MQTLIIAVGVLIAYLIAYHTYGRWLGRKVFQLSKDAICPSCEINDGFDYVPTKREVIFGHHFTSIAGTGPIVGPAIAVFWGWLPALIWVLVGSIFIGAVHDFGALVVSLRNQGRSIGDIASDVISHRVRLLFLIIIFFALWIIVAIFGVVIALVFNMYPQAVIPVWLEIPIAVWLGYMIYRKGASHRRMSIIAVVALYLTVILGAYVPLEMPALFIVAKVLLPPLLAWLIPGRLLWPSIALLALVAIWNVKELIVYLV